MVLQGHTKKKKVSGNDEIMVMIIQRYMYVSVSIPSIVCIYMIYTLQMKCTVLQQKGMRFTKILASKAVSGFLPSHGWDDVKKKCLDAFGYHDPVPVDAKIIVGDCELQIDDSLPNLESLIKCRPSTKRGGIGVCLPPNEVHHCILHCMSM